MKRAALALLALLALLVLPLFACPAQAAEFHTARSGAEKALEAIMDTDAGDDGAMQDYLTGNPARDPKRDAAYAPMFTEAFTAAVRDYESRMVEETCNGAYREDEVCGYGASYVTCGQEVPEDAYVFSTQSEEAGAAVIISRWPQDFGGETQVTHKMVKSKDGAWQLDGVACAGNDPAFNWHD